MKVAVMGSRSLTVSSLEEYLPKRTTEITLGGAKGFDACAREYAVSHGINAPLKRNISIIECADIVLAFWDGKSRGTKFVIERCYEIGKRIYVIAE